MQNSESLRTRLRELETAAEKTGAAVIAARTAHDAAIRRAVLSGDHAAAEQTDSVLRAAEREHSRTSAMVEECRALLAAAVRTEREAGQAAARTEIRAELATLESDATGLDAEFVALVQRALRLCEREQALRLKTRETFREVYGPTQYFAALRGWASYLTATAGGVLNPDAPASVARAVQAGAKAIGEAIRA